MTLAIEFVDMKKFVFVTMMVFMTMNVFAQRKGAFTVGGNISLDYTRSVLADIEGNVREKTVVEGENAFSVDLDFGYCVTDFLKTGVSFGYMVEWSPLDPDKGRVSSFYTVSATPFVAFYARVADGFFYSPVVKAGYARYSSVAREGIQYAGGGLNAFVSYFEPVAFEWLVNSHFSLRLSLGRIEYGMVGIDWEDNSRSSVSHLEATISGDRPLIWGVKYVF